MFAPNHWVRTLASLEVSASRVAPNHRIARVFSFLGEKYIGLRPRAGFVGIPSAFSKRDATRTRTRMANRYREIPIDFEKTSSELILRSASTSALLNATRHGRERGWKSMSENSQSTSKNLGRTYIESRRFDENASGIIRFDGSRDEVREDSYGISTTLRRNRSRS